MHSATIACTNGKNGLPRCNKMTAVLCEWEQRMSVQFKTGKAVRKGVSLAYYEAGAGDGTPILSFMGLGATAATSGFSSSILRPPRARWPSISGDTVQATRRSRTMTPPASRTISAGCVTIWVWSVRLWSGTAWAAISP